MACYRDSDGATRKIRRGGRTGANAKRNVVTAMKQRLAPAGKDISRESRLSALAEAWTAEIAVGDLT